MPNWQKYLIKTFFGASRSNGSFTSLLLVSFVAAAANEKHDINVIAPNAADNILFITVPPQIQKLRPLLQLYYNTAKFIIQEKNILDRYIYEFLCNITV